MSMTQQEAAGAIAAKKQEAASLISECEALADEHDIGFRLDIGGYGMGGYYEPQKVDEDGNVPTDRWGDQIGGWNASSQSC